MVNADAPITIDTEGPGAVGAAGLKGSVGVGDAVGKEVAPPQPDEASIARTASVAGILICVLELDMSAVAIRQPALPLIRASDHRGGDPGFKKRSVRNAPKAGGISRNESRRSCPGPRDIEARSRPAGVSSGFNRRSAQPLPAEVLGLP